VAAVITTYVSLLTNSRHCWLHGDFSKRKKGWWQTRHPLN